MGGNNLFRWSYYLFKQHDFQQSDEGNLSWFNTGDAADRLGGQLHIVGDILLFAAHSARASLSLDGPRSAPPKV